VIIIIIIIIVIVILASNFQDITLTKSAFSSMLDPL